MTLTPRFQMESDQGTASPFSSDGETDYAADTSLSGVANQSSDNRMAAAMDRAQRIEEQRDPGTFCPRKPSSIEEAGLNQELVEQLVCKFLLIRGGSTGRRIAQQIGLPFRTLEGLLARLKNEMLVAYRRTAAAGDYEYVLTDTGNDRARRYMAACTYADSAPVTLDDYIASVAAQTLSRHRISPEHLNEAFFDLQMSKKLLDSLGPAINAGKGMFLYGAPGNGKTTIAERVIRCFGSDIWIPRTIIIDNHLFRLFDPVIHQEAGEPESSIMGESLEDARWIRVKRPTVVVGGELTMDQLEMRHDPQSNTSEAPMQMKSNCGVLLIDDFGRQRMPVDTLLNRWIVPLEKRYDFQRLPSGKKIQVPFEQLVIFSTNLEPRDLVDEAFLRRIPYKIHVTDPTPDQFRAIFQTAAPTVGLSASSEAIELLIEQHYNAAGRPMRACHPRDLMLQARSYCMYHKIPVELTEESLNFAVENYFAVL